MDTSFSVVVPTYRPGDAWVEWLEAFAHQTVKPRQAIVMDSSSGDRTVELAERYGFRVQVIPKSEFEHGRTRMAGVEACPEAEIVVLLTQDAILASPDGLERLLAPFEDPQVGAVYGRQLPYPNATPMAVFSRLFSYPAQSSVRSSKDIAEMGMRVARFSNSFGAYRRSALLAAGGFPTGIIFGEDQYAVARMVLNGWKIVYEADAKVFHSHDSSPAQEFRRYFDIGVSHREAAWMLREFGGASGEGMRYVRSELKYLWRKAPHKIPSALLRNGLKLSAYRLGLQCRRLPRRLCRVLSLNRQFWHPADPAVPGLISATGMNKPMDTR
jgi:rhamnosyltransferase